MMTLASDKTYFFIKKTKPTPSIVYNTYWKFAEERQNIFFKKFNGLEFPWTNDQILNDHKFTNVYRATDRVSQYLIKNIVNKGDQTIEELFFRILLFKTFNKISTWEFLETEVGEINLKNYSFKKYDKILSGLFQKTSIYSAAYIMASGKSFYGYERKHQNHLKLIEVMIKEKLPYKLSNCKKMYKAYNLLLTYPTIGEFLAYQYITDLNYSSILDFDEMEFVKAGPGAKDGISKCFETFGDYCYEDIIRMIADTQDVEFNRLNIKFQKLWGRPLQLIDCQNIFCEVDKYSRLAHPEISGHSNRSRIKQKYTNLEKPPIEYVFPSKWNINLNSKM